MSVGVVDKSTGDRIPTAGDPLDKVGNLANLTTTAKGSAVEAINEVNAGLATKADLTNLAPAFSTATAYTVGQYVSYDGNIYKCTSAHSAGAWVAGDFTLVAVGSELSEINSNLTSLNNKLMRTSATFTANKWYKISTYTLNSAIWLDHRFLIAFNGASIKFGYLRSTPEDGFNNNQISITQIFGTAKQLGFKVSANALTVDIYIKTNVAGPFVYQILSEGGEGNSVVFHDPILTDLEDTDMTIYN